jgi:hypothetical protein
MFSKFTPLNTDEKPVLNELPNLANELSGCRG